MAVEKLFSNVHFCFTKQEASHIRDESVFCSLCMANATAISWMLSTGRSHCKSGKVLCYMQVTEYT